MSLEFTPPGEPGEIVTNKPINALLVLGQGIKPQVRGRPGQRQVVIGSEYDSQIWRLKLMAAKELAVNGLLHGPIITTGSTTANEKVITEARARKQADLEAAKQRIQKEKGLDYQPGGDELSIELLTMYPLLSIVDRNVALHHPTTDEDEALVKEMKEARLAAGFLRKVAVKSAVIDRVTMPVEVLEEGQARNTTQNILYTLNMLDQPGNGAMWNGTIGVITSNNGHLERADEILQAYGLGESQVVLLSQEAILHHYHYNEDVLARLEEHFQEDPNILQGHLEWAEGVKRLPEYVLSEIAILNNNERLRNVVGALRVWYQKVDIDIFATHPELADYRTMEPDELREKLKAIKRELPSDELKENIDIDRSQELRAEYDTQTNAWIVANGG